MSDLSLHYKMYKFIEYCCRVITVSSIVISESYHIADCKGKVCITSQVAHQADA